MSFLHTNVKSNVFALSYRDDYKLGVKPQYEVLHLRNNQLFQTGL